MQNLDNDSFASLISQEISQMYDNNIDKRVFDVLMSNYIEFDCDFEDKLIETLQDDDYNAETYIYGDNYFILTIDEYVFIISYTDNEYEDDDDNSYNIIIKRLDRNDDEMFNEHIKEISKEIQELAMVNDNSKTLYFEDPHFELCNPAKVIEFLKKHLAITNIKFNYDNINYEDNFKFLIDIDNKYFVITYSKNNIINSVNFTVNICKTDNYM